MTYNRAALLRRTLEYLATRGYQRIIVVDNCSTDDTSDVLAAFRRRFLELHVRTMSANIGGAGGFEAGVEEFLRLSDDDGDYALLHDDDSWPDFIASALIAAVDRSTALACFPVLHPDGDLARMNVPGHAAFLRDLRHAGQFLSGSRRPRTVNDFARYHGFDYCSFVGFLARRDVLASLGAPSAKFFIYSDDTTYTYLASQQFGPIRNFYGSGLKFMHDCRRASGRNLLTGAHHRFEVRNKVILFRLCAAHPLVLTLFFVARSIVAAPRRMLATVRAAIDGYCADKNAFLPAGLRESGKVAAAAEDLPRLRTGT